MDAAAAATATESGRQYNPDIYMRTRFTRADFNGCSVCECVSTMAKAKNTHWTILLMA